MDWVVTGAGALIVTLALRDIFHTLWHPTGQGTVSNFVMRSVWVTSQRLGRPRSLRELAGPLAMVLSVLAWAVLLFAGWTLVYWPHMPESFVFGSGLQPAERSDLLDAAYLSLVTVATLGFGDIIPQAPWLRAATPLQALMGFVLLTAVVSWVLQIYSALARRRTLVKLTAMRRANIGATASELNPVVHAQLLLSLADDLAGVGVDLSQYSETYYFRDPTEAASLPTAIGFVERLLQAADGSTSPDIRVAGAALRYALEDFADVLAGQRLVPRGDPHTEVLPAYADDHRRRAME